MGFFDKRKKDDDDDVEEVVKSSDIVTEAVRAKPITHDLPNASAGPGHSAQANKPPVATMARPSSVQITGVPQGSAAASNHGTVSPSKQTTADLATFGIAEAIQLARQLPNRNIDLVMQVVKKTLEAVQVDVPKIIEDAEKKERSMEDSITGLKKDIERLEGQIVVAKKQIAELEGDLKEVNTVKERLVIAQKNEATETDRAIVATTGTAAYTPKATVAAAPPPPPPAATAAAPSTVPTPAAPAAPSTAAPAKT